jgi:hypothetical protein
VHEATLLADQNSGIFVPQSGSLVLVLGHDSRLEPLAGTAKEQIPGQNHDQNPGLSQGPAPAPFAIQTAIAAVQAPVDGGAIIAINRIGLLHLVIQNRQVVLHRIDGATAEFAGRSVAQAWIRNGQAMVLLHRNEIFEPEPAHKPAGLVIAATADGARVLPGFELATETSNQEERDLYGAPYALFPRARDRWLVQFRLAGSERTMTAFAAWNPDKNQLYPLERSGYESMVQPAPMNEAPAALRLAAETMGGSLVMETSMPDGTQQTWLRGSTDAIRAVRVLVTDTGVLGIASDGRMIMVTTSTVHETQLDPPVPQAYFRDLALLDGFIIVVWEEDLFPDIGRSGLVIMDASRLDTSSGQPDF